MNQLKRLLKRRMLESFLTQAQTILAGGEGYIAVLDVQGQPLAQVGDPVPGALRAPLLINEETAGWLTVGEPFTGDQCNWLTATFQTLVDSELGRRAVSEETLEQYRELSLLHRVAISLNNSLDPKGVAAALLMELRQGRDSVGAGVCLALNEDGSVLELAAFGVGSEALSPLIDVPLVRAVLQEGRPEIFNELGACGPALAQAFPFSYLLAVPLTCSSETVGLMLLANRPDQSEFEAVDLTRAETIASMAAGALRNARLFEQVMEVKNYNENVLASLSNGVITLDPLRRVTKANKAACKFLPCCGGDLEGRALEEILGADNQWLPSLADKAAQSGATESRLDHTLTTPGGGDLSLNATATPLLDLGGRAIGTVLVLEDITKEKRIKNTMSRYMPDQVVEQLLGSDVSLLGGKEQQVSILFSDIRRFTALSENLSPEDAVAQLNDYFADMVDILFDHGGALDKFIGDGIMALFGAPFVIPQDADNAVNAAVAMIECLATLNQRRAKQGLTPFKIGIGVNTGSVIVGNIGSPKRMDFTVIGDHVNLASRLESANKYYGSQILVSEYTRSLLQCTHMMRELDQIRVVGRRRPVRIYEVLDFHRESDFPRLEFALNRFAEGIEDFRARRFRAAAKAFGEVVQLKPDDKPSVIYLQRCLEYGETDPGPNWDGVVNLRGK